MRDSRRNFLRTATLTAGALSIPRWAAVGAAQEPSRTQDILVRADVEIGRVRPELHGQFAEHLGSCI